YASAFASEPCDRESGIRSPEFDLESEVWDRESHLSSLATIVRRYLQTHALVGLADLAARYPIDPAQATELLERWESAGGRVRLEAGDDGGQTRWGEPRNLAEVRRLSIALRRRESVAVLPEVFAEFVSRLQHVHPATRLEGPAAIFPVLDQLQGFAAPADS